MVQGVYIMVIGVKYCTHTHGVPYDHVIVRIGFSIERVQTGTPVSVRSDQILIAVSVSFCLIRIRIRSNFCELKIQKIKKGTVSGDFRSPGYFILKSYSILYIKNDNYCELAKPEP